MKAVRLLQIIVILAAGAYLLLLHDMNEVNVVLPFLFSLPPSVVVVAALGVGWLLGWLPSVSRSMKRSREIRRLQKRLAELEKDRSASGLGDPETPVIPDRSPYDAPSSEAYDGHENL